MEIRRTMTRRGFWFLAVAGGALIISIALPSQYSVTLLSLTAILWYALSWSILRWQRDFVIRRLRLVRWIDGKRIEPDGPPATLWEDRPVIIWIKLEPARPGALSGTLPRIIAIDRIPARVLIRGKTTAERTDFSDEPISIGYEMRPRYPGRLIFHGVLVEIADPAGFFRQRVFIRGGQQALVYPALVTDPRTRLAEKKYHRLLAAGVHRHRRPGSGTELLALRDYIPGDPPKRIAWRISARRDIWTTKDFESDVPVRATIFLDHSSAVRVGWPGTTPLVDEVRLASALIRYWLDKRDPVGLVCVDDDKADTIPPATGPQHEAKLLRKLCDVTTSPPKPSDCSVRSLLGPAREACEQLYPDLLDPTIHRRYSPREHWWSSIRWLAIPASAIAAGLWWLSLQLSPTLFQTVLKISLSVSALLFVAWVIILLRRRQLGKGALRYQETKTRKEIASVIAAVEDLGFEGLGLLMHHDPTFIERTQQFLIDHDFPYPRPLHDASGQYVFASSAKARHLANSLLSRVLHAQDNELFLLLVDLFEIEHLEPLLSAIKVAQARHHEVIVAAPWPAELMDPADKADDANDSAPPTDPAMSSSSPRDLIDHYFKSYQTIQRELGRLRVPLILARPGRSIGVIVERVESLRASRIHARR
jgi:uncharacterized protein (DUF58 family)